MVLKGPRFRVSPVRTYVVVGSLTGAVSLVVGASSPSSDLVILKVLHWIHSWHHPGDYMFLVAGSNHPKQSRGTQI